MEEDATEIRQKRSHSDYRSILKRISAFGGVQLFSILINLIRGKFVAILLGPEGMGLSSMLTSSTNTVQQFAGLGLNLAMVKEVAAEQEEGKSLPLVLTVAVRLIYFTAILGCLVCLILSPLLSLWSFGSYDYTLGFAILSAGVGLSVAGAGYLSLLQGLGEVKRLAWASVVGGLAGLFFGVPLYYFFGLNGIVPALLIFALTVFLFYFFTFKRSVSVDKVKFKWSESKPLVRKLISLGVVLMIGSLVGTLTNYLINIFIRAFGSLDDVGLFQAANSITNQYVGIVFSAMALDYFPRLSAVAKDREKMCEVVNRQMEIVLLIVTPIILILQLSAPIVIELLLSKEFLVVIPLVRWLAFGVLLQAVSFPMSYLFIAKDNKKVYVWMEVVLTNVLWIICSIVLYWFFSLIGLGVSLVVRVFIDIMVTYLVCRSTYGFRIMRKVAGVVAACLLLGTCGFIASLLDNVEGLVGLIAALAVSATFSLVLLRKGITKKGV